MARKPKRPDNNKRLAELEAKEAEAAAPMAPTASFTAGQRAAKSGIPKHQAPVFYSDAERVDWHKGYDA